MPRLDFASLLRQHRLAAGLSQEELARQAGLSRDAVAALERGRRRTPRPQTVRLLTEALHLTEEQRATFIASPHARPVADRVPAQRAPAAPDQLVGRVADLAESKRLLTQGGTRLLTLTGPGGVGKTRLATEIAAAASEAFADGVHWASLGSVSRSSHSSIIAAAAAALDTSVPVEHDRFDPLQLAERIGERRLLLVLDNCEHVVYAVAELCGLLLRRCPALQILATSREALRVPGETTTLVHPLPSADAVRLFVTQAAAHGAQLSPAQLPDVRRICQRLDGIPLAIELAAARVNVLTVAQIAAELSTSFRILTSGSRTAPERQKSLRAAIEWSHDLLSPDERTFFAAMSVFHGGWTISAAQALSGSGADGSYPAVVDLTSRLADKSLFVVRRAERAARYDMFDVIREYAAEQLSENRRRDVELRHLRYFTGLAEKVEGELVRDSSPNRERWLSRLDAELDNFRVAMRRAAQRQWSNEALRLSSALCSYGRIREHVAEVRNWLESALKADEPAAGITAHDRSLRTKALDALDKLESVPDVESHT